MSSSSDYDNVPAAAARFKLPVAVATDPDGRVYVAVAVAGRKARGRRAFDLLIAATAIAAGLPLYTRNADDFAGLSEMLEIVTI